MPCMVKNGGKVKEITKIKLREAQQFCDDEDKSTEFMLQYMQDYASVDLDCVLRFIEKGYKNE